MVHIQVTVNRVTSTWAGIAQLVQTHMCDCRQGDIYLGWDSSVGTNTYMYLSTGRHLPGLDSSLGTHKGDRHINLTDT